MSSAIQLISRVHSATMTTSPTTTMVAATHSSRLGQVTRFISDATERNQLVTSRQRFSRSTARLSAAFDFGSGRFVDPFADIFGGVVMLFIFLV
jgi:hypothetical protein